MNGDALPLLEMEGIRKRFAGTQALDGVSLRVGAGDVLALVGENGAGKSTLMKVLSGAHRPDSGVMRLAGEEYAPTGPHAAREAGVAMIYQELNLAPDLTVEDNIMLGQEARRFGWLRRSDERAKVHDALALLGHAELQPRAVVGKLPIGLQQLVEIARALAQSARVIVFDEPTSSLPQADAARLFRVIGDLARRGLGVIYISHFLDELRAVGTHYCVLRDGRSVGGGRLAEVSEAELITLMVGRTVGDLFPSVPHTPGEVLLAARAISGRRIPRAADLSLRRGEVLGVAGLVGAGRTELLRCLFGLDPTRAGELLVAGRRLRATPRARMRAGLGYLSEDRKHEGLAQRQSIEDNLTLSRLDKYWRWGWLNLGRRRRGARDWMDRLRVKARGPAQSVGDLSGGNQQKVAIARLLHQDADILLLDEPTRGIDVGTKAEIYRLMGELAADGRAIIFVSSYLPELFAICDRIAVMSRGRLRAVLPTEQWTEESLMSAALGGELADRAAEQTQ